MLWVGEVEVEVEEEETVERALRSEFDWLMFSVVDPGRSWSIALNAAMLCCACCGRAVFLWERGGKESNGM